MSENRRSLRIGFDLALLGDRNNGTSEWNNQALEALVRHFPEHSFYLLHAAPSYPSERSWQFEGPNVKVILFNARDLAARVRRRLGVLDESATYVRTLRTLDLLHWNARAERHFRYLQLLPRLPKVVTLYDATTDLFPQYHTDLVIELWNDHYARVLETGSWWTTISESSRNDLVRLRGLNRDRSSVIYPHSRFSMLTTADDRARRDMLERLRISPGEFVLNVGVLEPRKNHARLLRVFRRLKKECPEAKGWKLVLTGKSGWHHEEILREATETPDVVLAGCLPDHELVSLYRHAGVFVYPSLYEGFGLPVLEAMSLGAPVITSRVSSLPEVAGDAAMLLDPADEGALFEAMAHLVARPDERRRLSQMGLEHSLRFSAARMAEELIAFYERVVTEWRPVPFNGSPR